MTTESLLPTVHPSAEGQQRSSALSDAELKVNSTKRKRAELEGGGTGERLSLSEPESGTVLGEDAQKLELLPQETSADNPRLTISRHPTFNPLPNAGDPPLCATELCLMNRALASVGYRYYPAGLAEPGNTIAYRTIESIPTSVRVSWEDRSTFVRVSEDGLELGGQGGFRSARANVPVREGKWYMEVDILKSCDDEHGQKGMRDGSHVRLGWGRREAPLNGPVGLDGYSYGYRDKTGEKVSLSRPKPYGKPFRSGDTVGLYISLPPRRLPNPDDPLDPAHMERHRIAIKYRGQEYWEQLEYSQTKEMMELANPIKKDSRPKESDVSQPSVRKSAIVKNLPGQRKPPMKQEPNMRPLPTLGPEAVISFFINGECQGVAFQDIFDYLQLRKDVQTLEALRKKEPGQHSENPFDDGTLGYYPLFSLYGDARIRMNPGPDFKFPPPNDIDALLSTSANGDCQGSEKRWRPLCQRYNEFMQEMWAQDLVDEERAKVSVDAAAAREIEEAAKKAAREKKKEAALKRKKAKSKEQEIVAASSSATTVSPQEVEPDSRFGPDVDEFFVASVETASYAESVGSIEVDNQSYDSYDYGSPSESVDVTGPSTPVSYNEEDEMEHIMNEGGLYYSTEEVRTDHDQAEVTRDVLA